MGTVWRARDTTLGRLVAVKLLHQTSRNMATARRRFTHEARVAAALRSPNIVQIYDYGWHGETPYLVMELLQGRSLATHLAAQGRLGVDQTCRFVEQIGSALSVAHERGIIHRDLKPANVFLCDGTEPPSIKLLDFGIAKATDTATAETAPLTESGAILGTPRYMSPEQLRCKDVDARADLWSLAVIAFECVCGERPFEGKSLADLVMAISGDPIPRPSRLADVPAGFDEWFLRGVSRDPAGRFDSAEHMAASLATVVAGRSYAAPERLQPITQEAPLRPPTHEQIRPEDVTWEERSAPTRATSIPAPGDDIATDEPQPTRRARTRPMRRWLPWATLGLLGFGALATMLLGPLRSAGSTVSRARPSAELAPSPSTPFRRVVGDGYVLSVPAEWEALEVPINTVAVAYRAPKTAEASDDEVDPQVKLVVEPWGGSLSDYVELGLDNMQDVGKVHHQRVTRAGEHAAIEAELSFHKVTKPYRSLKRVVVADGWGYVLSCDGPIEDFDPVRPTCQRIMSSLRVHTPAP